MYYLQSRYYNAEWGRFINADDIEILLLAGANVLGTNLFAYCLNNPILNDDQSGHISSFLLGAIAGAITGALIEMIVQTFSHFLVKGNLKNFSFAKKKILTAAFFVGLSGAFSMSKYKRLGQGLVNGLLGMVNGIADSVIYKKKINLKGAITDFLFGFAGGFIAGAGFGEKYYQKSIFSKGGYYLINGVTYRSVPVFQKALFREFVKSLGGSFYDLILSLVKDRV